MCMGEKATKIYKYIVWVNFLGQTKVLLKTSQ